MPITFEPCLSPASQAPVMPIRPAAQAGPRVEGGRRKIADRFEKRVAAAKNGVVSGKEINLASILKMNTAQIAQIYKTTPRAELRHILKSTVAEFREQASVMRDDDIRTFVSTFLCYGWVCRVLMEPGYADVDYEEFNHFCRKLPENCRRALDWEEVPRLPLEEGRSFKSLGFHGVKQGNDNLCSLHTVNAAICEGSEYSLAEVSLIAKQLSRKNNVAVKQYFSVETGLSIELRNVLLAGRGLKVHAAKEGLTGPELFKHLVEIDADMCVLDSFATATQFPNGLIARAPHSALIRRDEKRNWWLINSMESRATPVNFKLIKPGKFLFTPVTKENVWEITQKKPGMTRLNSAND